MLGVNGTGHVVAAVRDGGTAEEMLWCYQLQLQQQQQRWRQPYEPCNQRWWQYLNPIEESERNAVCCEASSSIKYTQQQQQQQYRQHYRHRWVGSCWQQW